MYPLIHPLSAHTQVADPWAQSGLPRALTEETWAHPHAQPGIRYPVSQSPVSLPHYDSAALPQGPGAAAHHHFLSVFTVGPRPSSPPHHRPPPPSPDSGDCTRIAFSNSSSHSRLRVACPFLNRLTTALSCRGQHSLAFFFPASTYKADRRHQPPHYLDLFFFVFVYSISRHDSVPLGWILTGTPGHGTTETRRRPSQRGSTSTPESTNPVGERQQLRKPPPEPHHEVLPTIAARGPR